ncbi:MAG: type II and III secretion system protein family protein [Alphaproteobacteria bacterium]|jgi:pilus assembly protein CpaC|nr:type II and III secretion system protein family protein [Alphaproteobacteria bacterium]
MSLSLKKINAAQLLFAVAITGLCVIALPALVLAEKGDLENIVAEAVEPGPVYITLGKAELIDVDGDIADVLVANPSIIDVMAVQSNRLYIVGLKIGDTNIIALDENGDVIKKLDIHVKYDLKAIQAMVNDLYPDEDVEVKAVHDQIVMTGTVSTPEVASRITSVVASYVGDLQDQKGTADELISNLLNVRGEQQVMLQVKIVEASRSILKELGVNTDINNEDALSTSTLFNENTSFTFGTGGGIGLSQDPTGLARFITDTGIAGIGDLQFFLRALEEENLIHVLAEPNLTAVSGQKAGFLAGGEFPVPVGRDNVGNVVVEFREFGVSLNFKPIVLSDNRISLQLNTEVSSLDFDSAVVLADVNVPGLDVRKADTTVEVQSGGSLMIAGLLQSESIKGMAGLPGINKTPILGDLVKSDSFRRDETELVVIVTPYLVEPYAEKNRAERTAPHRDNPLARSFAVNVRKSYEVEDDQIFSDDEKYGYILD